MAAQVTAPPPGGSCPTTWCTQEGCVLWGIVGKGELDAGVGRVEGLLVTLAALSEVGTLPPAWAPDSGTVKKDSLDL